MKGKTLSVWKCKKCGSTKKSTYKEICKVCYNRGRNDKKYNADAVRKYAHANKDKIRERAKRVYKKDKTKAIVRAKTNHSNERTFICGDCKNKGKTEFHHESYEPNIFVELCKKCHNKRHGRNYYGR